MSTDDYIDTSPEAVAFTNALTDCVLSMRDTHARPRRRSRAPSKPRRCE